MSTFQQVETRTILHVLSELAEYKRLTDAYGKLYTDELERTNELSGVIVAYHDEISAHAETVAVYTAEIKRLLSKIEVLEERSSLWQIEAERWRDFVKNYI